MERSREFYQMQGSRDLYNGTSFRMSTWSPETFYSHDDVNIDFVSYKGCLLYCTRSHWSSESNEPVLITNRHDIIGIEPNPFWDIVHTKGMTGEKGEKGDKGDKGEKGDPGHVSIEGKLEANATAISTSDPMANVTLSNNTLSFTFGLPKGERGEKGDRGDNGLQGIPGEPGSKGDTISLMYLYQDGDSYIDSPEFNANDSNPGSLWSSIIPEKIKGRYIWRIEAEYKNYDFVGPWTNPCCLSGIDGIDGKDGKQGEIGPVGPAGPTGSQGVSGVNGVSFNIQYCVGDVDTYIAHIDESKWDSDLGNVKSQISNENPYIWCRQGQTIYDINNNPTLVWGPAFRLQGINGLNGKEGGHGQIIYPMGIYNSSVKYTADAFKAPYVFDPLYNAFYVLNTSEWDYSTYSMTPGQSVDAGRTDWVKFESFEAIYSKIGIIANGLIGSAVFNEDFMFSQMGINPITKLSNSYCDIDGNMLFSVDANNNPYHENAQFWPSFCVNLKTGQMWTSNGNVFFDVDGSGKLAKGNIRWDTEGNLYLPSKGFLTGSFSGDSITKNAFDYQFSVYNGGNISYGKAVVKLISADNEDGTDSVQILMNTTEIDLPTTISGTVSANRVKGKYLLLYIDDSIGAKMDFTSYVDKQYNTFKYIDNGFNSGWNIETFIADSYQYGDDGILWIGAKASAKLSIFNSGYDACTFQIELNGCTSDDLKTTTITLAPDEEKLFHVNMTGDANVIISEI